MSMTGSEAAAAVSRDPAICIVATIAATTRMDPISLWTVVCSVDRLLVRQDHRR
jgi:hypothetical protein